MKRLAWLAIGLMVANAASANEVDDFLTTTSVTGANAAAIGARCDAAEALVKRVRGALERRTGAATIADFAAFDSLAYLLTNIGGEMYLIGQTAPAAAERDAGRACSERISALQTEVSLSRPIYDRLAAIPAAGIDAAAAYTLSRQILDYRIAGVDKDAATRAKVEALNKEITQIGLEFDRNISEDRSKIVLVPADLAGLPQDYIDTHKPGADGKITLTTAYPDVIPVFQFASLEATRRKVADAFYNRAYPVNDAVLKRLIAKRDELARTLGQPDYATLVTANKMAQNPARIRAFVGDVDAAARPAAQADTALLAARYKQAYPGSAGLNRWSSGYIENLVKKERYAVDAAEVRKYFTTDGARDGIFRLVRDLFGGTITPWATPVWADGVTAWQLAQDGRTIGYFYLDLSPRDGKYSHAAQFTIRSGKGTQLPIAALVTNFPASGPMDHEDVITFLHEFGHLIHTLYSGHQTYGLQSMDQLQWDFIEAPSQLLEEWAWDAATLKTFARDAAGNPIPDDLVKKMNVARLFGEARLWESQLGYAMVSLDYYSRPTPGDLTATFHDVYNRYGTLPSPAEWHEQASFGHLNGYSAIYYTYVWSKAIAEDMLTRFKAAGIRDTATAVAYRRTVLEAGSTKSADALVTEFLGRPWNAGALRAVLKPVAQ